MARKKGGRRGSKAKKTPTNKYNFRDARMQYHLGNFAKAASILRQANISAQEKEQAKQLEIAINQQLAYNLFTEAKYQEVIDTLTSIIQEKEKQKEFWIIKIHIFVGLSHLYLGAFESAKNHLSKTLETKETTSFSFYYLLADLYQNHATYSTEADFSTTNHAFVPFLDKAQKNYLTVIFSIFKNKKEEAIAQIELLESKSRTQKLNIEAIHAILSQSNLNHSATNKIKPFYKLLLNFSLSFEEKNYLATFKSLKAALEKQALLTDSIDLQTTISALCQKAEPIPSKQWMNLMKQIPQKYKSTIVYNQTLALSKENFAGNFRDINRILETFHDDFFEIPESIFLYFQIVAYDVDSHYFYIFWKNVNTFIERFSELLTPGQFNRIGWNLYEIFTNYERQHYAGFVREIRKIGAEYHMLGIKMFLLLEEVDEKKSALSVKANTLFASKEVRNNERQIIEQLTDFTESLHINDDLFSGLSELLGLSSTGKNLYDHETLSRLQQQLFKSFSIEIHPSSKDVIFKIYKILHQENEKALEDTSNKIALSNYESLKENYLKSLIQFKEKHPDSIYYKDYKALLVLKNKNDLIDLLQGRMTLKAQKQLKKFVQSDEDVESIIEVFMGLINQPFFNKNLITSLAHFFYLLGQENPQKAVDYGDKFVSRYLKECKIINRLEHSDEFFLKFMEQSMTKFNDFLFDTFYRMAQIYPLPLTNNKSALHYRVIGLLLENTMDSLKKNVPQKDNDAFHQALLSSLGAKIKRDKRLKKLKKLHQEASIFFENHNK